MTPIGVDKEIRVRQVFPAKTAKILELYDHHL
jgi:hypothetical protein